MNIMYNYSAQDGQEPVRRTYKGTYLHVDEEYIPAAARELGSKTTREIYGKREGEPDGNSETPVRGRREMFRLDSKLYENGDIEHLKAEKDLSPISQGPLGARDWTLPSDHNRSVSTTSNNNGYHNGFDLHNRNNHSSQEYPEVNSRNSTMLVPNSDTTERNVFSNGGPERSILSNGLDQSNMSNMDHLEPANRSLHAVRNSTNVDPSILSNRTDLNDLNKSALSNRNDLNHSIMSSRDQYGHNRSILTNRDLGEANRSVLSYHDVKDRSDYRLENGDVNRSVPSRDLVEHSFSTSLACDTPKVPTHKQNGFAKPVKENLLSQSSRGLTFSRASLAFPRLISTNALQNGLVNTAFICLMALILAVIGLQLLFRLTARQTVSGALRGSILSNSSYQNTVEVAVAVASVVVMLDLCCLMVCSMQAVFAAKLLRCSQGEER